MIEETVFIMRFVHGINHHAHFSILKPNARMSESCKKSLIRSAQSLQLPGSIDLKVYVYFL
jgi:hypothetical protein